jgi:hypothetical protein
MKSPKHEPTHRSNRRQLAPRLVIPLTLRPIMPIDAPPRRPLTTFTTWSGRPAPHYTPPT